MQLNLQHSLSVHLAEVTGLRVIWMMDGVVLPDESTKPYLTIEQMQNNNRILSKGREAIETVFRFQIGLRADTSTNRSRIQSVISRSIHFDDVNLIDLSEPLRPVVGFFNPELISEVPISAENVENKSAYHKVYFDVEVRRVLRR